MQWINAIGYNPTWPYWTPFPFNNAQYGNVPVLKVTSRVSDYTIKFTHINEIYSPPDVPWVNNLFVGAHLYDPGTQYFYPITIASMTNDSITLDAPAWQNASDIVGHTLIIAARQLSDSDFFNSAFESVWNTPRVDVNGTLETDVEAMRSGGFNTIRLYNWNPYRSNTGAADPTQLPDDQHIPFLNDVYYGNTAGTPMGVTPMKVLIPVSNFFLGDTEWAGTPGSPADNNYAYASAPPLIQNDLQAFIKSVVVNGKLSPAVMGFEIGNEIDLNAGTYSHGDDALLDNRCSGLSSTSRLSSRRRAILTRPTRRTSSSRFRSPTPTKPATPTKASRKRRPPGSRFS